MAFRLRLAPCRLIGSINVERFYLFMKHYFKAIFKVITPPDNHEVHGYGQVDVFVKLENPFYHGEELEQVLEMLNSEVFPEGDFEIYSLLPIQVLSFDF